MAAPTGAGKLYTGSEYATSAWLRQQGQANCTLVVNMYVYYQHMPKPTGAGKLYTGIAIPVSAWLGQPTGARKLYTGCEYG